MLALGERDEDSLDSYHGPAKWQDEARTRHASLDTVRADAVALRDRLATRATDGSPAKPDDNERRAFLIRQLDAVAARVDILRGSRPSFAAEAHALFGIDTGSVAPAARDPSSSPAAIRGELDRLLPGHGDLAKRYAAFDARFRVAPPLLPPLLTRAMAACRAATAAHIPLPEDERIDVAYVPELRWSAFTRYQGARISRIEINPSLGLTVDRVLDLACHEGYPGHHTIETLVDARFPNRTEFLVQPLFSPQALLREAAASIAPALAFSDAARIDVERELFVIAGFDSAEVPRYVRVARLVDGLHGVAGDIAKRYLDGDLEFSRALTALERDALMASGDATLRFVNRFRTYAATYTIGRDLLEAAVAGQWSAYAKAITDGAQMLPASP